MEDRTYMIKLKKECETMLLQMNELYNQLHNDFAGLITNFPNNWQMHFIYLKYKYNIDSKCPHCQTGKKVLKYFSRYNSYYVECDQRSVYNKDLKRYENYCEVADREYVKDSDIVFDKKKLEVLKAKAETIN